MTSQRVNPVPDNYPVVTPILQVEGAARRTGFLLQGIRDRRACPLPRPDNTILFAEVTLGERGLLMVRDVSPEAGAPSPQSLGGTPVTIAVYVPDVDATVEKALRAGAELIRAVSDEPDGERVGSIRDPFGHVWSIASHLQELSYQERVTRVTEKNLS